MRYIDLRSDTVTQPTREMREAMYNAVVGDDVYGDDPTANRLEQLAAAMLGKEAALFLPSGTMANQIGVMCHTSRGDEVILSSDCHIFIHEVGAVAVLSGANLRPLSFPRGIYDPDIIEKAIRPEDIHQPRTALICLENALGNGRVVPAERMAAVYNLARQKEIAVHLDGARLFNAAIALGVDVREISKNCDTLSCCLSKGLAAPVGSLLAGDTATIDRARKYRKMLGGGMRQCGVLAAAGIIALEEMVKRLPEDHENARYLAKRLTELAGVEMEEDSPQINMVFFKLHRSPEFVETLPAKMLEKGIKINEAGSRGFRLVTSNEVCREDIDYFIDILKEIC